MRIIYVTSSLPHGKKEAFIIPEIEELERQGHEILVVPTYPRGEMLHGDAKSLMGHVDLQASALGRYRKGGRKAILGKPGWSIRGRELPVQESQRAVSF